MKANSFKNILISSLTLFLFSSVSCTKGEHAEPNVELIQDMMDQPNVKAQEYDDYFSDNAGGARVPPEHTMPIGFKPYKYAKDFEGAKSNKNPISGDMNPETLRIGQKYYETNCTVCHGMSLKGDGPVSAKFPIPVPALNTDKVKGWSDGQIYHVITMGQGVMGSYASHIPQKYRWQVVNYIRYLQNK